ncbi:MAG TPA: acyltransferase, partial [Terriglobales bacterium]|nr:acyltransferase [Terriglobales bacterium]
MNNRIPSLDGMRALSILMVLVGHAAFSNGSPVTPNHWTHTYAHYGVCIFFVISGFLITTILEKERASTGKIDLRRFFIRRAYRILPVAYVFIGVMILTHYNSLQWGQMAAVLTYTSSYVKGLPFYFTHLWSLSVEEQFY